MFKIIFLIVNFFIIQQIFTNPNKLKNSIISEFEENEFPFLVLLIKFYQTKDNKNMCRFFSNGVLINENSILINSDSLQFGLKTVYDYDQVNGIQYYTTSDIYVVYGVTNAFQEFFGDTKFQDEIEECQKIKRKYPKIVRYEKYPIEQNLQPQFCIGIIDENIKENGKNVMYADLYEDKEDLKDEFLVIGLFTHEFFNDNITFNYKLKKMSFPYLGCDKCKMEQNERKYCFSQVEECVGYLNHSVGYYSNTSLMGTSPNSFGSPLMWGKKKPEDKRWVYYGNPTVFFCYYLGKNVTNACGCISCGEYSDLRFSNILFVKISHYVNWIWNTVEKPPSYGRDTNYPMIAFVFIFLILLIFIPCFLFFVYILIKNLINNKKEERENNEKMREKRKRDEKVSTVVKNVMEKYTEVPEWMQEESTD